MKYDGFLKQYVGKPVRRTKPKDEEHLLQVACVNWFRTSYPNISHTLFAVPNGGRRDKTTGARLKAEGVLAGVADLILLRSTKFYGALLIEMKTPSGRQSDTQRRWSELITKDNYKYVVVRSLEEFMEVVKNYLKDI